MKNSEPSAESTERGVAVYNLGTTSYDEVHRLQQRLQSQRREGQGADTLLLTEHRPVFTLGRSHTIPDLRVDEETVRQYGIEIVSTERGGNITYHGPGQLVGYGIIDVRAWNLGVIDYVRGLEDVAIGLLADWGLRGTRNAAGRGVWVNDRKIASVGLNVRRWITMHGIAINIDPDMSHWDLINACGMPEIEVTSMVAEVGKHVAFDDVLEAFIFHFARVFDCATSIAVVPGTDSGRR